MTIKKYIYIAVSTLLLYGCANIMDPSGGPDDTTAPEIISYSPDKAAINIKSNDKITIRFSEYVNKSSVIDNIRISPKLPLDYDWSGKELEISFLDTLNPNTTYCLTIDSKYSDVNNVKPKNAFSMIFSSGNSIDSGKITGKVFNPKANQYSVFAYRLPDSTETFDLRKKKADYYMTLGSTGEFTINALKNGMYRVVLVEDKNDNQFYEEGSEEYSSSEFDVNVLQDCISKSVKLYKPAYKDTLKPAFIDAEAINNCKIKLEFSEPIDTFSINPKAFKLIDSVSQNEIKVLAADNPDKKRELLFLYTQALLDKNKKYKIEISKDSAIALRDTAGNIIDDKKLSLYIIGNSDSLNNFLTYKNNIKDSTNNIELNQKIELEFNVPIVNPENVKFELRDITNNRIIDFVRNDINSRIIRITPSGKYKSANWYSLNINMSNIFNYYNGKVKDTVYNINFQTADKRDYGSISGRLQFDAPTEADCYVILTSTKERQTYTIKADENHKWEFADLPPGDYKIEVFLDSNKNGKYDSGSAFPFTVCEKYFDIPMNAKITARWKVEDFIIKINNM